MKKLLKENAKIVLLQQVSREKSLICQRNCLNTNTYVSLGGCKHVVAFIMWVHRRSEEPAPTDVQCYWKKSKLAGVGTSFKYTTIKDFGSVRINQSSNNVNNFLEQFLEKGREAKAPCQVLKHLNEDNTNLNQLGLHEIICDFLQAKHVPNFDNFVQFAADKMTLSACKEAFLVTGDQSELRLWHNLRYGRITASKLYDVSRCKTASGSLVENIIGTMKIRETSAMKRGKDLEKKVISILGKKVNIKFKRCGIMLSPKYPILGASPDAISDDFVVEIKCPSSERTVTSFITADGQVPNKHKAQIMLQMLLLEKYKGIFCVADPSFEENLEIKYVIIDFDKNFIEDVIKNSISFWKENIFPILIN